MCILAKRFTSKAGKKEVADVTENCKKFGSRLPAALKKELNNLETRLGEATLSRKE